MRQLLLIDWVLITALGWLVIGLIGVILPRNFTLISRVLFPLGAALALMLWAAAQILRELIQPAKLS